MTHWLSMGPTIPILTYASVIWWLSMEKKCNITNIQNPKESAVSAYVVNTRKSHRLKDDTLATLLLYGGTSWVDREWSNFISSKNIIDYEGTLNGCYSNWFIPDRQSWIDGILTEMLSGIWCCTDQIPNFYSVCLTISQSCMVKSEQSLSLHWEYNGYPCNNNVDSKIENYTAFSSKRMEYLWNDAMRCLCRGN